MALYWLIIFFIWGLILGSFYNVIGLRVPKNLPFTNDRSHCPNCGHVLRYFELIPVISFLWQRGACRHCGTRISPLYPVMELITGSLFALGYAYLGFTVELGVAIAFISMLIIVIVADITYMVIPNNILLFFLPLFVIGRILSPIDPWYDAIIGAFAGTLIIALIIIISRGGMGAGDMKLFFLIGMILGWQNTLLTLFIASLLGSIIGGNLMLMNKVKKRQPVPFGPFIAVAAVIAYFYGDTLLSVYMSWLQ